MKTSQLFFFIALIIPTISNSKVIDVYDLCHSFNQKDIKLDQKKVLSYETKNCTFDLYCSGGVYYSSKLAFDCKMGEFYKFSVGKTGFNSFINSIQVLDNELYYTIIHIDTEVGSISSTVNKANIGKLDDTIISTTQDGVFQYSNSGIDSNKSHLQKLKVEICSKRSIKIHNLKYCFRK